MQVSFGSLAGISHFNFSIIFKLKVVAMIGAFGNKKLLTPVATMIPAVAAKVVSCLDPFVYAISHPRYRAELEKKLPWLGIREDLKETGGEDTNSNSTNATTES